MGRWGERYLIVFGVNCMCIIFKILQEMSCRRLWITKFLRVHDPASLESFVMATSPLISQYENSLFSTDMRYEPKMSHEVVTVDW